MRPELAAFRELDTLVRNLSDQLAGYRRRALSAESRVRELEYVAEELKGAVESAELAAKSAAQAAADAREELRKQLTSVPPKKPAAPAQGTVFDVEVSAPVAPPVPATDKALVRENTELRARVDEATARTRELGDRLRFLRQQITAEAGK